jgi:hypothetical protein
MLLLAYPNIFHCGIEYPNKGAPQFSVTFTQVEGQVKEELEKMGVRVGINSPHHDQSQLQIIINIELIRSHVSSLLDAVSTLKKKHKLMSKRFGSCISSFSDVDRKNLSFHFTCKQHMQQCQKILSHPFFAFKLEGGLHFSFNDLSKKPESSVKPATSLHSGLTIVAPMQGPVNRYAQTTIATISKQKDMT